MSDARQIAEHWYYLCRDSAARVSAIDAITAALEAKERENERCGAAINLHIEIESKLCRERDAYKAQLDEAVQLLERGLSGYVIAKLNWPDEARRFIARVKGGKS